MPPPSNKNTPQSLLTSWPTPGALLRAAARRWFCSLVLAGLLGMGAGYVLWRSTPPRYSAELKLQVKPAPTGVANKDAGQAESELLSQAEFIKSPPVLALAAGEAEIADLAAARSWSEPAEKLAELVHVDAILKESVLRIRVNDADANTAAAIARATAIAFTKELKNRRVNHLQELKESLTRDPATVVKETPAPVPVVPRVDPRLAEAEAELVLARADQKQVAAQLASLRDAEKAVSTPAVSDEGVNEVYQNDPFVLQKQRELQPIEEVIQRTVRIAVEGEKDPSLRSYLARRDSIRSELASRRTSIRKALEQQARGTTNTPDLGPQIRTVQARLATLAQQEKTLETEIATLRIAAAKAVAPPAPPVVRVVTPPTDSESRRKVEAEIWEIQKKGLDPYWVTKLGEKAAVDAESVRRQQTMAGAGGAAGALFGLLLVGFAEFRTRRVTSARDVARGLGLPVFGALPRLNAQAKALADPGKAGDAVDILRTTLLGSVADGPCVIVVTSPGENEGKAALAAHLAASLARSWHKTVLIDGANRPADLRRAFGVETGRGLAEVLRGEVEAEDVLQTTAHSRLWVMPAGRLDAAATQALALGAVAAVLNPLKEQFDCVVVDAAALGTSQNALLLSPHADAVVLSVLPGVSVLPAVYAAHRRLEALGGPVVGAAVLNAAGEAEGGVPLLARSNEPLAVA